MIAHIYVKTNDKYVSMLVSNDKGNIYYQKVIDSTELTGIQRCVSFIKHQLDYDKTEIYPDKLGKEILEDNYISHCNINPEIGKNPNEYAQTQCTNNLSIFLRWNFIKQKER